ncbi:MAG: carbohydrate kinase family protein [Candidatus Woesebacteria bacterium]
MNSLDVVSIGSAVVDLIFKSDQFTPHTLDGEMMLCEIYGGKANVQEAALSSGGSATNTAVGFARQGLQAGVISEVGKDIQAQIIIDECMREKVDISWLIEEPEEQTGMSAVLVASDGSRSAMTFRGASHMLTPQDIPFEKLQVVPWIHLGSIGNPDLIRQIFLFCKEHNISLSWNPGKVELEEVVKNSVGDFSKACAVLCINDQEFAAVADKKAFLEEISQLLVITKGKQGGEIWKEGEKQDYVTPTVSAVCELGAGDAFMSGFVGACIKKLPLEKAIEQGVANAVSVVSHLGAKKGLLSFS